MFKFIKKFFKKPEVEKVDVGQIIIDEIENIREELIVHKKYRYTNGIHEDILCLKLLLNLLKEVDKNKWDLIVEDVQKEFTLEN